MNPALRTAQFDAGFVGANSFARGAAHKRHRPNEFGPTKASPTIIGAGRLLHHGSNSDGLELRHPGFAINSGVAHDGEQQRDPERDHYLAQPIAIPLDSFNGCPSRRRPSADLCARLSRAVASASGEPLARSSPSAAASNLE